MAFWIRTLADWRLVSISDRQMGQSEAVTRADRNNNPAAMTTAVAHDGGLQLGVDYAQGTSFISNGQTFYTARLLGDPIAITIRAIDVAGFYTKHGTPRWTYADGPIGIPRALWNSFTPTQKKLTVKILYDHEGGTAMKDLFS